MNIKNIFLPKKGFRVQTMNFSESHRLFFLFIIGIVGGTFLFNMLGKDLAGKIGIYSEYMISDFNMTTIESIKPMDFFMFCIRKYCYQSFIIILLITLLKSKSISGILCIVKGINISFLVGSATISFGVGGILIYIMSIFPHYFFYVPLFIWSIYLANIIREIFNHKRSAKGILKACIIEFAFILGTSLFEAYGNLPIMISMFT